MNTLATQQIQNLLNQGCAPEAIAEGFGFNLNAILLIKADMATSRGEKKTLQEKFGDLQGLAINALKGIVLEGGENKGAIVAAAKVLLDEHHSCGKIGFDYEQLTAAMSRATTIIDIESDVQIVNDRREKVESELGSFGFSKNKQLQLT